VALIKCRECKKQISDKSEKCINCGYEFKKYICPECGKNIKDLDKPCGNCGYEVEYDIPKDLPMNKPINTPVDTPVSAPTKKAGKLSVNNTWVWILAFAPLIGTLIEAIIAEMLYVSIYDLFWITIILNIALVWVDEKELKKRGVDTSGFNSWWIVLIPLYIYKRAKAVGDELHYFIVWIVAFIIMFFLY